MKLPQAAEIASAEIQSGINLGIFLEEGIDPVDPQHRGQGSKRHGQNIIDSQRREDTGLPV